MSKFMSIVAVQPPIDAGVDPTNRQWYSTNYRASIVLTDESTLIEREILGYLQSQGILTIFTSGTAIPGSAYYGSRAVIPAGSGPFILLKMTGGYSPNFTHSGEVEKNITFQISVWSASYDACRDKAWDIHDALNGKRNLNLLAV